MKRLFVLLFLPLFCFACNRNNTELEYAESLLQEKPDSALMILQSFSEKKTVQTKQERAKYSLLFCAACDKNYIDLQSDSIIRIAVDYFSDKPGKYRYLSNYYHGVALKNMRMFQPAIVALEKAGNEALQLEDYQYSGLAERNKAAIFNMLGNNTAAQDYQKKAIASFEKLANKSYLHYALRGLVVGYANNNEKEKALQLIDSIYTITTDQNLLHQSRLLEAAITAEKNENPELAIKLYNSIPSKYFALVDYGLLAISYEMTGKKDSADLWFNKGYDVASTDTGKATLDYLKSKLEEKRGHYPQAYRLVNHATLVQDSLTRIRLQESASAAQRDYYSQELKLQEQKSLNRATQYRLILSLTLLVLVLLSFLFILSSRKKEETYRDMLSTLHSNEDILKQMTEEKAHLLSSILKEKLLYLDALSSEYCNTDSEKAKNAVYKKYKETLLEMQDNPELFSDIEDTLNRYCDGVVRRFREQFPHITGEKLYLAITFFTGIPYKAIQHLFKNHSVDSLKTAKNRLRKMITESDAKDSQLFLDMLEMKKGRTKANKETLTKAH